MYALGIRLLDILELIHDSGLVYNDLKPDNILVGYKDFVPDALHSPHQDNIFSEASINLIDFGMATYWQDKTTGKHNRRDLRNYFEGNMYFSSMH